MFVVSIQNVPVYHLLAQSSPRAARASQTRPFSSLWPRPRRTHRSRIQTRHSAGPPDSPLGLSRDTRRGRQHGRIHLAGRVKPGYQREIDSVSVPIRENSRGPRNVRPTHDDSVARWGWIRYRGCVAVIVSRVGEIPDTALTAERLRCSVIDARLEGLQHSGSAVAPTVVRRLIRSTRQLMTRRASTSVKNAVASLVKC
jgi:hypothetical protein